MNRCPITKSSKEIPPIDIWSIFYLFVVYSLTMIFDEANIFVFAIYLICAIPFINHLDKFACICFLLSTMSYYFLGCSEGIWSIYTIFACIMIIHIFCERKSELPLKSCLYLSFMIVAVLLSYTHSEFGYAKGMYAMIYNIAIAALVAVVIRFNKDTVASYLPKITVAQLMFYIVLLLINGNYDGYGYSISKDVNHNTFGASIAILSGILFVMVMFYHQKSNIYKLFWLISLVLTFVSGSRNALLALMLSVIVIYIIVQKQHGKIISGWLKLLVVVCVFLFLGGLLLPELGVDLTRYNYVKLFNSGGSNRAIIWETLSPIIWKDHKWFGYGPSHFCSEQMIIKFMKLDYKHTHNTIFEAWGELGICGLVSFILILVQACRKAWSNIKMNKSNYIVISFLLFEFLLLSLGESFFAKVELWIVIGMLLGCSQTQNILEAK